MSCDEKSGAAAVRGEGGERSVDVGAAGSAVGAGAGADVCSAAVGARALESTLAASALESSIAGDSVGDVFPKLVANVVMSFPSQLPE